MDSTSHMIRRLIAVVIAVITTVVLTGCWSDYGTITEPKDANAGTKTTDNTSLKDGNNGETLKDSVLDTAKGSSLADTTAGSSGNANNNGGQGNATPNNSETLKDAGNSRINNRDASDRDITDKDGILNDAFYKEVESRSPRIPDTKEEVAYEVPKVQPATQKGWSWYNNEKGNYTFLFPNWLNFNGDSDGVKAVFTANALGKKELTEDESYDYDTMKVKVTFIEAPKGVAFDEWATKKIGYLDESVSYKSVVLKLAGIMDSEGPFGRVGYVPIDKYGLVRFELFYNSTPDINDEVFEKKARNALYEMIYSTQQLYVD